MPTKRRWIQKRRRRRVFELYTSGLDAEQIGRVLRITPKATRRLFLRRVGVEAVQTRKEM